MARLARFYGWSPSEIYSLDTEEFNNFLQAANRLEAIEEMSAINVAISPNMKDDSRKKLWRQLQKKAGLTSKGNQVTTKELFEILSNR